MFGESRKSLTIVLTTPNWSYQSLYVQILDLCIAKSSLLTQSKKLLLHPQRQVYPLALTRTLKLVHWKISRKILILEENSKSSKKLISSFRRSGTKANYQSTWKQKTCWCRKQNCDPNFYNEFIIVVIPVKLLVKNFECCTLNCHKSTISI